MRQALFLPNLPSTRFHGSSVYVEKISASMLSGRTFLRLASASTTAILASVCGTLDQGGLRHERRKGRPAVQHGPA